MYNILYIDSTEGIFGGGQVSLLELLKGIDRARFRNFVVLAEGGRFSEEATNLNIECRIIKMPVLRKIKLKVFLETLFNIGRFINKHKIGLIYANTSRAAVYAGITAKILRVPMVWQVRIPHSDGMLDKFLAFLSTKIIVVSHAVEKRFSRLSKNKIELVYNGVDINRFRTGERDDSFRARFNFRYCDKVIGMVGRLSSEKGHSVLISAVREVVKFVPEIKVMFVGEGPDDFISSLKEKIKELKLSSYFVFMGFHQDVSKVLNAMDIFCLPSLTEGFNRSLLEAMASELPVIVTSVGGNIEIVKDEVTGLIVPPNDSKALAEALISLLKDLDKAKEMGIKARSYVEENFSIEKNVDGIESVFLRVLANK